MLYLNIEDNGTGVSIEAKMKSGVQKNTSGLLNLQSLAAALRTQICIKIQPDEGTCINIKMSLLL